jgi:hypothetical protein
MDEDHSFEGGYRTSGAEGHYNIFDFRQRKFRQRLNKRSQKGYKQRFLRCCQVFTNSQISCTKPLPLCFRQRFIKRGYKKPLPLCFRQRFEKRGQKQPLPIWFMLRLIKRGYTKPLQICFSHGL